MTVGQLRVGFAGAVRHARQYASVLAADPRVQLVGMTDAPGIPAWMSEAGAQLCRSFRVPWMEPDQLLRQDFVDLVVVCTEPTRHSEMTIAALDVGVHVCCDKPVATDVADAAAVAEAAARSGRVCAVVNRTFAPSLQRLRSWVDAGHLGLPRHVDVEFLTSSMAMGSDVEKVEFVVDPALSGGGEMRNFLGYAIDTIRFLTGLEIIEVYAEAGALFDGPHALYGVEDTAVVSLLLTHGVTATATVARCPAVPSLGTSQSSVRVIGSHGHAAADDESPRVLHYGAAGAVAYPAGGGGGSQAVTAFFNDLIDAVLADRTPAYTAADALAGVTVVDAAYASVRSARPATC